MLKLIKQGGKLENRKMAQTYGGDDCGMNACDNCGTEINEVTFHKSYIDWFAVPNV
jgi:hypothetical protein